MFFADFTRNFGKENHKNMNVHYDYFDLLKLTTYFYKIQINSFESILYGQKWL